jgi:hypothetical protein
MQPEEIYESWKQRRAKGDVPADFADNVMAALPAEEVARRQGFDFQEWCVRLLSSPLAKVCFCTLGCLAFVLRMGSVIALFLAFAGKVEGAS